LHPACTLQSIEDIVSTDPVFIRNVLLDCLPFEGSDPLSAGKKKTAHTSTSTKTDLASASGDNDSLDSKAAQQQQQGRTREREEESCAGLAVRIIKLARLKLREDIDLKFQERSLMMTVHM
jgi:hypothetical protein